MAVLLVPPLSPKRLLHVAAACVRHVYGGGRFKTFAGGNCYHFFLKEMLILFDLLHF